LGYGSFSTNNSVDPFRPLFNIRVGIKTKALETFTNLPFNRGKVVLERGCGRNGKSSGSASPSIRMERGKWPKNFPSF
jgi:hypothetical protein